VFGTFKLPIAFARRTAKRLNVIRGKSILPQLGDSSIDVCRVPKNANYLVDRILNKLIVYRLAGCRLRFRAHTFAPLLSDVFKL
jgi:hypothetical protein